MLYFSNIAPETMLMHFIHFKMAFNSQQLFIFIYFFNQCIFKLKLPWLGNLMFKIGFFILENVETPDLGN